MSPISLKQCHAKHDGSIEVYVNRNKKVLTVSNSYRHTVEWPCRYAANKRLLPSLSLSITVRVRKKFPYDRSINE